jgi:hypothetical protein
VRRNRSPIVLPQPGTKNKETPASKPAFAEKYSAIAVLI